MAYFLYGELIKRRRIDLGISQGDLARGICSNTTLSRLEGGERLPRKEVFHALMERLGLMGNSLDYYSDRDDYEIYTLKEKIRWANINGHFEQSAALLDEMQELAAAQTPLCGQFVLMYRTFVETRGKPVYSERFLNTFTEALRLTMPGFEPKQCNVNYMALTHDEVILLNNIANQHGLSGNHALACNMFYDLKRYFDFKNIHMEAKMVVYALLCYNLSKWLGLSGRYDECIRVCDDGIRTACETGRASFLPGIYYNKAWSLIRRNEPGDKELAIDCATNSVHLAKALKKWRNYDFYRNFAKEELDITIS